MKLGRFQRGAALAVAGASVLGLAFGAVTPATAASKTTITWLTDNTPTAVKLANAMVAAFQAANPGVTVEIHTRGGGADADNLVKTKLATGNMEDVFNYNSGALLQAIAPTKTLVNVAGEKIMKNVYDSFKPAVSVGKQVFGTPWTPAMGGGIYYNIADFKKAGITSNPKTWAELITDAKKIKALGIDAFCGTFGDSWTAQLFVLADFYNVNAADKKWVTNYTNNKAKYATTPAALKGFQHLEEAYKDGLYNADAATAKFTDGTTRVVSGQCAMYPMLTFVTAGLPADKANDVGFMAQPGDNANNVGLTTWMPMGMYIPKTTKGAKLVAAKKFQAFIASKAGTDVYVASQGYMGPFMTKDQSAPPADTVQAAKDLAALVKSGKTFPALEFLSPIKGPNLLGICVQVATGQVTAAQGAALYDQDVIAQAQQLGLKGW